MHTSFRDEWYGIAARLFDERATNGVSVLMGGGATYFLPPAAGGTRKDGRDLVAGLRRRRLRRAAHRHRRQGAAAPAPPPKAMLGLFHPRHMAVAFDKVGAGRYSDELALERNQDVRDQPMLADMTSLALASLAAHSPRGFYLMVEGASIDKQAHESEADRTIWDTIEFDNAVKVALDFARRTNSDADPANDTLVVVTADHESGGFGIIGVGNERYAPTVDRPRRCATTPRPSASSRRRRSTSSPTTPSTPRASRSIPIRRASCSSASPPGPTATRTGCRTASPWSARWSIRRPAPRWPTRAATARARTATTPR